eukprot:TRINITY_DN44367_c0_g1_i1.p1 TRINITY_DN44367_c0_g1~~TRINITY_DN44367_c0_g1_i1.p1  ORF type:complete len:329 (+),score=83.37 TRINITY_DN44367_c0_g1_i1:71-1057(+)
MDCAAEPPADDGRALWDAHSHNHHLIRGSPVHHALRVPGHEHKGDCIDLRYDAPEELEPMRWRVFRQDPALGAFDPATIGPDAPPECRDRLEASVRLGEGTRELSLFCFLVQCVDPVTLLPDDSGSEPAEPCPAAAKLAAAFQDGTWTGTLLWDAALCCSEMLIRDEELRAACRSGPVVELGCGLGLPGMVASLVGAPRVFLTDRELVSALAEENARRNGLDGAVGRCLDWSDGGFAGLLQETGEPAVIIACDCIFFPLFGSSAPLLDALLGLAGPRTLCVVSSERRPEDGFQRFCDDAEKDFETLRRTVLQDGGIVVLELRRRPPAG